METLSIDSITPLLGDQEGPTLSIYIPLSNDDTVPTSKIHSSRLNNLIQVAERKLSEADTSERQVRSMLDRLTDYIHSHDLGAQSAKAVALFVSEETISGFALPLECEQRVTAGDSFDVAPLLALMTYDQEYYVLALAVHEPKLFKGTMYGIESVPIEFPKSPEEALNIDELYSNSNTVRSGSGSAGISTHGQGDSREAGNEERLKYFRIIDNLILTSTDIDASLPLLIAGTSSEAAEYRALTKLPNILDAHIDGNYTKVTTAELHARTWPAVEYELQTKKQAELMERYGNGLGSQKASQDINDIEEATTEGRVDTLLIGLIEDEQADSDIEKPVRDTLKKLIFPEEYVEQEISTLALNVLNQGGSVVGVYADKLPRNVSALALYRY